jgi:hypothetical protein
MVLARALQRGGADMELPLQSPPVLRWYMRDMVGRRGRTDEPSPDMAEPPKTKKGSKGKKGSAAKPDLNDYVIEPTVVHIRRPWR